MSRVTSAVSSLTAVHATARPALSVCDSFAAAARRSSASAQAARSSRRRAFQARQFLPRRTPPATATDTALRDRSAVLPSSVTVVNTGRSSWCAPRSARSARCSSSASASAARTAGSPAASSASRAWAASAEPEASSQACSSSDMRVTAAATSARSLAKFSVFSSADRNLETAADQSASLL